MSTPNNSQLAPSAKQQKPTLHQTLEKRVRIRVWMPTTGTTMGAKLVEEYESASQLEKNSRIGHASVQISNKAYASFWPMGDESYLIPHPVIDKLYEMPAKDFDDEAEAEVDAIVELWNKGEVAIETVQDLLKGIAEKYRSLYAQPDIEIDLYSLDTDKMLKTFQVFKSQKMKWDVFGSLEFAGYQFKPNQIKNCSGLAVMLLRAGGIEKLFQTSAQQFETLFKGLSWGLGGYKSWKSLIATQLTPLGFALKLLGAGGAVKLGGDVAGFAGTVVGKLYDVLNGNELAITPDGVAWMAKEAQQGERKQYTLLEPASLSPHTQFASVRIKRPRLVMPSSHQTEQRTPSSPASLG